MARSAGRRQPRIGLTTYRELAAWGVWHEPADLLPASYATSVAAAGGAPVLLAPVAPELAETVLDGVHGLVLAGGPDVDPARYAAARDRATGAAREERDTWELHLVRAAIARDLPVLAVCRGMQVLDVALGGTLVQHLPDRVGHDGHSPRVGVHGRHGVHLAEGSAIAGIVGTGTDVATYHHQAVDRLGGGLVASGWADDGTVEAVELPTARWVIGVQWHPEVFDGEALFTAFVRACHAGEEQ